MRGRLAAILGVAATVTVFLPLDAAPVLALLLAVACALLLEPRALGRAWRGRFLALAALVAAATGALVAWASGLAEGVSVGAAVLMRLLVLALLAALAARHVDADALLAAAGRLGLARLGLVLGLALNALPHLGDAWRDAWIALGVRRRGVRPRLRDGLRLAENLLAHAAKVADEAAAAAALRGHRALLAPPFPELAVPHLVLVTGRPGGGKTPALAEVFATLAGRGVPCLGFAQIPVLDGGEKVGFRVRDLVSGEERPLATRVAPEDGEHGTSFRFDPAGFALAAAALARRPGGGVLFADEIGPVELRGGGHMPALRRALRAGPAACVLTVRRHLIVSFLALLAAPAAAIVDVEREADPAAAILAALAPALPVEPLPEPSGPPLAT